MHPSAVPPHVRATLRFCVRNFECLSVRLCVCVCISCAYWSVPLRRSASVDLLRGAAFFRTQGFGEHPHTHTRARARARTQPCARAAVRRAAAGHLAPRRRRVRRHPATPWAGGTRGTSDRRRMFATVRRAFRPACSGWRAFCPPSPSRYDYVDGTATSVGPSCPSQVSPWFIDPRMHLQQYLHG